MSVKLLIKRGTYNDVNTKLLDIGELVITTDTRNLYVGTPYGNTYVGRCEFVNGISTYNKPSAGQFVYDISTDILYVYDGTTFKPVNSNNLVNLRYTVLVGNAFGFASMDSDGDIIIDTTLYYQDRLSNVGVNNVTFTGYVETINNLILNANTVYFFPFSISNPLSIKSIGISCRATSTSTLRFGVYSNVLQTNYSDKPDTLLFSTNSITASSVSLLYATFSATAYLYRPGIYWIGISCAVSSFSTSAANCSSFNFFSNDGASIYRTIAISSSTLPSVAPSYPTLTFSTNLYPVLTFRGQYLKSPTRDEFKFMV